MQKENPRRSHNWLAGLPGAVIQRIHYKELSVEQKLYFIGGMLNLAAPFLAWPVSILFEIKNPYLFYVPVILGCVLGIIGLTIEVRRLVGRARTILRPVILVLSTAVVYVSAVVVRYSINWATGHDPANYPTTTVIFGIVVAVTLWIGLAALIALVAQVIALVGTSVKSALKWGIGPSETAYDLSSIGRLYAITSILAVLLVALVFLAGLFALLYENDVEVLRAIRTVIVSVDYYPKVAYCSNFIPFQEKAVFLDGNLMSVAIPDPVLGYRFEIRSCEVIP